MAAPGPFRALEDAARDLGALGLEMLDNRLELASVELRLEKLRLARALVLTLLGAVLALLGLAAGGALLVLLAEPEQRVWVLLALAGVLLAAALAAWLAARGLLRRPAFEYTRRAIRRDGDALRP